MEAFKSPTHHLRHALVARENSRLDNAHFGGNYVERLIDDDELLQRAVPGDAFDRYRPERVVRVVLIYHGEVVPMVPVEVCDRFNIRGSGDELRHYVANFAHVVAPRLI